MAPGTERRHVAVASWFFDDQPGFLDFQYRVESLGRHHHVTLLLRHERFRQHFDFPGVEHVVLQEGQVGTRQLFSFCRRAAAWIRGHRPDGVVLLGAQLAPMGFLLDARRVALYWNEHPTHTFHGGRWGLLSRLQAHALVALSFAAARRVARVMPIGEAHRDDLLAHGVGPERCTLIYMGVHARFLAMSADRSAPPAAAPLEIVYTGTVEQARGRDVMLEGLAWAVRQGVPCRLTIVGASDEQLRYCSQRADELGIAHATRLVGRVPGDQIPAYLQAAAAGVCIWEDRVWWRFNPPTKLFEYLAAGLPVLASRIRTHTLYVEDGRNGLVFDYDATAFGQALQRLHAARADLPAMSKAAARSGATFAWSQIEPSFLAAVDGLFAPGPARSHRSAETPHA